MAKLLRSKFPFYPFIYARTEKGFIYINIDKIVSVEKTEQDDIVLTTDSQVYFLTEEIEDILRRVAQARKENG